MPFPVNLQPRGLLGWLQSRVEGQNPSSLSEVILPTIGLEDFYWTQTREHVVGQGNSPIGIGQETEVFLSNTGALGSAVPFNEAWFVRHFQIVGSVALIAGDVISAVPGILSSTQAQPQYIALANSPREFTVAGQRPYAVADRPFIALPGDRLIQVISRVLNYPGRLDGSALISRMQI